MEQFLLKEIFLWDLNNKREKNDVQLTFDYSYILYVKKMFLKNVFCYFQPLKKIIDTFTLRENN